MKIGGISENLLIRDDALSAENIGAKKVIYDYV